MARPTRLLSSFTGGLAATAAFGLLLAGGTVYAAGKVPADVKVTAVIADQLDSYAYRIGSDNAGPYPAPSSTTTKVTTQISSNMEGSFWILTTYYTSRNTLTAGDRKVWFDLSEPAPSPFTPTTVAPIQSGYVQAQLVANCYKDGVDLLTMTVAGGPRECRGAFRFQNGTRAYRLAFQPQNYAETERMKVTCTENLSATTCKAWTVTPSGNRVTTDPNPKSLVRLVEIDPSSEAILNDTFGNYYISFSIAIARR